MRKDAKMFDYHPNPVMMVFIRKPSQVLDEYPYARASVIFAAFLHHFVLEN